MNSIIKTNQRRMNYEESSLSKLINKTELTKALTSNLDFSNCLSNCSNNGICKKNGTNYICECFKNFTGQSCHIDKRPCSNSICFNSGICIECFENISKEYFFKCLCRPLFYGELCQFKTKVCENVTCSNNGYCVDNSSVPNCICFKNYFKEDCSEMTIEFKMEKKIIKLTSIMAIIIVIIFYILCFAMDFSKKYCTLSKKTKNINKVVSKKKYIYIR